MSCQRALLICFRYLVIFGSACQAAQAATAAGDVSALLQEGVRPHRGGHSGNGGAAAWINPGVCAESAEEKFAPNGESLRFHQVPRWFKDAKLGIFIHWGLYSVPAFAATKYSFDQRHNNSDYERNNPYAEWYLHSSITPGSATAKVHRERYGEEPSEKSYLDRFVPEFNSKSQNWNPSQWADAFQAAGAKYVVLTTKHHDSFCLWPSSVKNPMRSPEYQHASRDIVGELSNAVRGKGMEMGLYYSGGKDWSFRMCPGRNMSKTCRPDADQHYTNYAYAHLKELIARYRPSILWNDIGWPGDEHPGKKEKMLLTVFAQYFNMDCPQGVVNQRWRLRSRFKGDFNTPEYERMASVTPKYHEMCRGIGRSFGYNAEEGESDYMSPEEAIWLLATETASNGNLLLDVGPAADGTIPARQMLVLQGLGEWMSVNGEAIHGSRPYLQYGRNLSATVVYTRKGSAVYALVRCPAGCRSGSVTLDRDELMEDLATAELLTKGGAVPLQHAVGGGWKLPDGRASSKMPLVFRIQNVALSWPWSEIAPVEMTTRKGPRHARNEK